MIRLGTLAALDWHFKLYAFASEAAGLRPEDTAAAQRAVRAVLVEPGRDPVAGFAILSAIRDPHYPPGSLALTACHWDGGALRRSTLLIPVDGPMRRIPDQGIGMAELFLAASECRAWQRHAARGSSSSAAYVAEDCA